MSLRSHLSGGMVVWLRGANRSALLPVQEGIMAASRGNGLVGTRGPALGDCQRLWDTLVTEYVTDLKLSFELQTAKEPQYAARMVCWSPGLDPETGGERPHIWATKEISMGYEAITYIQLYDLLIQAYRQIESHLGGQVPLLLP